MGVIFDLDQTLVDSSLAANYRKNGNWSETYKSIKSFTIYDGVGAALEALAQRSIPYVIVTSSPSGYCQKVCTHWNINPLAIIAYHDTRYRKPDPAPMILALQKLQLPVEQVLSFGDHANDIISSNRAKVASVACLWGSEDGNLLSSANPTFTISTPNQIIPVLEQFRRGNLVGKCSL